MPLRLKAHHFGIKDTQAVRITLLAVSAHQLLPDADTQDRILQVADNLVQAMLPQVTHRIAGLPLSGEQHLVCLLQLLRVIGKNRCHT